MQNSIVDAVNAARDRTVAVTMATGGDPVAVAAAKAEQDKLQSFKTLFESLLKG